MKATRQAPFPLHLDKLVRSHALSDHIGTNVKFAVVCIRQRKHCFSAIKHEADRSDELCCVMLREVDSFAVIQMNLVVPMAHWGRSAGRYGARRTAERSLVRLVRSISRSITTPSQREKLTSVTCTWCPLIMCHLLMVNAGVLGPRDRTTVARLNAEGITAVGQRAWAFIVK